MNMQSRDEWEAGSKLHPEAAQGNVAKGKAPKKAAPARDQTGAPAAQFLSADRHSVFHNEWWAEATSPGSWDKVEITDAGQIVAEFTYARVKKFGFWEIGHPYLARTMEPQIAVREGKFTTQLSAQVHLIGEIAAKLPKHDYFWYNMPPDNPLELAYGLAGYQTEGSYTFRSDPADSADPWEAMDRKTRNHVRSGQREFTVDCHFDLDRFIRVSRTFLKGKTWLNQVEYGAVERVFAAAVQRGQAAILSAVDQNGQDVAATIVVWDDRFLYYWMSARNPDAARTSALSVLIWSAIELAAQKGLIFDMDGYASAAAGLFYAKFGLKPHRRTHIRQSTTVMNWTLNSFKLAKSLAPVALKNQLVGALKGNKAKSGSSAGED